METLTPRLLPMIRARTIKAMTRAKATREVITASLSIRIGTAILIRIPPRIMDSIRHGSIQVRVANIRHRSILLPVILPPVILLLRLLILLPRLLILLPRLLILLPATTAEVAAMEAIVV